MNLPVYPLGNAVMDEDHFVLEQMLAHTPHVADDLLIAHFDAIASEIAAHFKREEVAMEAVHVPVLHCHRALHAAALQEVERLRALLPQSEPPALRHLIGFTLAQLLANHIANVDQIASTFFGQEANTEAGRGLVK
jgi:hemerythrin-like metal-binding protein